MPETTSEKTPKLNISESLRNERRIQIEQNQILIDSAEVILIEQITEGDYVLTGSGWIKVITVTHYPNGDKLYIGDFLTGNEYGARSTVLNKSEKESDLVVQEARRKVS